MNYAKQVQDRFYKENEDKAGTLISDLLPGITTLQAISLLEGRVQIQNNGVVQRVRGDTYYEETREVLCNIDIKTALFKDQPEEVQKKIAELLGIK